jgi:glycosylphosphatidylinositol transamidase (GPIT) subunit GPI8
MDNRKTAMQELFDNLESIDIKVPVGVKKIFLEKEKEQMDKISEDWWVEGCAYMKDGKRIYESFEQYYNQTFKNK